MAKKILKILDRYSYIAKWINGVVSFIQKHPEIVDALFADSFIGGLGILIYIGVLLYLWYDYIKQHPVVFGILLHIYNHYMIY